MTTLDELQHLVEQHETEKVDSKRKFPNRDFSGFSTDIVPLANAKGDRIIFGIMKDGSLNGVELTRKERERISQEASKCYSTVSVDFENVQHEESFTAEQSVGPHRFSRSEG